jgi:hypothetical protein
MADREVPPPPVGALVRLRPRPDTLYVAQRFFRKGSGAGDYEVLGTRGTLHVVRQPSPWSLTAGFGERLKDALTSLLPGK